MLDLDKEKLLSLILGLSLLIAGVLVLFFVFSYASGIIDDPQAKLNSLVEEETTGPTASFQWFSSNTTVEFYDFSSKGDSDIVAYNWDFGDGESSSQVSPTHEYDSYNNYTVTLTVEDENGESDELKTRVSTQEGGDSGQALKGFDLGILNIGNTFKRIVVVVLLIGALTVLVLIGGKILLTGARLIRPTSENLKIRSKEGVVLEVNSSKEKNKTDVKKIEKEKIKPEKSGSDKEKEINDFFEKNQR